MARKDTIARSVTDALTKTKENAARRALRRRIRAFFTIYAVPLHQHEPHLFSRLRTQWEIEAGSYGTSFQPKESDPDDTALQTKGNMGYSGSTFFTTNNGSYLVKSIPRHFENSFFRDDLLEPYVEYMSKDFSSLLIRITDFLAVDDVFKVSPGLLFGFAPSHHVIMQNLLIGRNEGEGRAKDEWAVLEGPHDAEPWKWETWDLKPTTYFFPERDIAQGKLASQATKSRLADELNDSLVLTESQSNALIDQLKHDTELLERCNAVDYSLFLVRIPIPPVQQEQIQQDDISENPFSDTAADQDNNPSLFAEAQQPPPVVPTPKEPPFTPPDPPSWRTGVKSADGRYVYRAAILDFFWAKHKVHAKMMTHLVNFWNKLDCGGDKGPMSITTTSPEYRERFLKMCEGMIHVREGKQINLCEHRRHR